MPDQAHIRNFCIIAHIDHGKSTLADRLLQVTGTVAARDMVEQLLDSMPLEREKGITIKARAVRMRYQAADGAEYELNLIDTPGHVDFTYEVSRSLAACEGAILVVDAAQGIEAQTLANVYLALEHNLALVPVVNKIDLPSAQPELVAMEIDRVIGLPLDEIIFASAKEGRGVPEILEAIVKHVPSPQGTNSRPLRALIFDSHYDSYKGVIAYCRIVDGEVKTGDKVLMMASGVTADVLEIGVFTPEMTPTGVLRTGEVGYVATGLKGIAECQVGDTITLAARPADEAVPGYRPVKPMVFAGVYPVETVDYQNLRDALDKLHMNDASLVYEPESSTALGFGFRCGFLGLLHMEIIQERLEREYGLELLTTAPSVEYRVTRTDGTVLVIDNPAHMPDVSAIRTMEEPWMQIQAVTPTRFIGAIMELVTSRRGLYQKTEYLDETRVALVYDVPLSEMIVDFYDQLKSRTQGYASLDYTFLDYRAADLVKLDILVNAVPVDALSIITHRDKAIYQGRSLVDKLRRLIPRQMFDVPIQAAVGSKVIARETISAMRKNVLAKCYGGDISRKRKLLEKQKEGKARMKMVGSVEIPQEAFLAILSLDEE
ncbi:MAG TPA: translation elongation factor 4 [Chloroflexia bacterium]|nr:translation elongation factor 4 [Chloroflexia bacterium]